MSDELKLSIVIPVYNEKENVAPLLEELVAAFDGLVYEVVVVNDGSTDDTAAQLERLKSDYAFLRVLNFPDNRGQSAAMLAGFDASRAQAILVLDGDGQNIPRDGRLLADRYFEESGGPVAVIGFRIRRADGWWKAFQSKVANFVRDFLTGDKVRDTGCSLKVMPRRELGMIPRFNGVHRFLPTLLKAKGVRVIEMPVSHRPRIRGVSKYGMWRRLIGGLRDAFRVRRLMRLNVGAPRRDVE